MLTWLWIQDYSVLISNFIGVSDLQIAGKPAVSSVSGYAYFMSACHVSVKFLIIYL